MDEYLEDGVYTIYPVQDTSKVIQVYHQLNTWKKASKTSLGTWYVVAGNGDNNHQKFLIEEDKVGSKVTCMANGLCMDVWRWDVVDNNYPIQWKRVDSGNREWESQIWDMERDSRITAAINGMTYTTHKATNYWFREGTGNKKKKTLVWSMHGGNKKYPEGWLALESNVGGTKQRFVLVKDIFTSDSIEAPSNIGISPNKNGSRATRISVGSAVSDIYPYWECSGNKYQISYRWRGRKTGSNDMGGWSIWYAVADASNINGSWDENGWGDPWNATTTTSSSGRARTSNSPIKMNIDQNTYDKKEIELCIRQFKTGGKTVQGVHTSWHNTVSKMIYKDGLYIIYRPNLSCSELGFSPLGLIFSLTSDFRRNGNRATINHITINGKKLVSGFNVSDLDYTGNGSTLRIPMSSLAFIPKEGDTANISVTYSTIDGTWTYNFTKRITYNASHGLSINPTFSMGEGQVQYANLNGNYTSAKCWLLVEHDGRSQFVECERGADGRFIIVPPVGVSYQLFFTVENSSGWGTRSITMPPIKGYKYIIFNWNGGYAVLPWDTKSQWGLERDSEAVQTQGRLFESVFFGKGSKRPFTVSGRLLKGDRVPHATFEDFEKLSVSDYAVVRFPTGGRYDISIEKVSFTQDHSQYREVTINGREVS